MIFSTDIVILQQFAEFSCVDISLEVCLSHSALAEIIFFNAIFRSVVDLCSIKTELSILFTFCILD